MSTCPFTYKLQKLRLLHVQVTCTFISSQLCSCCLEPAFVFRTEDNMHMQCIMWLSAAGHAQSYRTDVAFTHLSAYKATKILPKLINKV